MSANGLDLPVEFFAAAQIAKEPRYQRRLADLGFCHIARRCCGAVGVARVQWHEGFRGDSSVFEPDPDGNLTAVILPVLGQGIEDLVAWDVRGNRLASRTGATFGLGEIWLSGDCESVRVFTNPCAWWRACEPAPVASMPDPQFDRDLTSNACPYSPLDRFYWHPPGLVVIDWNDVRHRLRFVKRLIADCLPLAGRLEKAVQPLPVQHPEIFVDVESLAA